jgi:hypothetical protein
MCGRAEKEMGVELSPVTCNSCGASLQIPESANYVTCRYCNAQLHVRRSDSTISTEVLNRIDARTAEMADDLDAIRRESEIERLDREWRQREDELSVRQKDGSKSAPSIAGGIIMLIVLGGFGLAWTIGTITMMNPSPKPRAAMPDIPGRPAFPDMPTPVIHDDGPPAFVRIGFPLFGLLFVGIAIAGGIKMMTSAGKYEEERKAYLARREQLLATRDDVREQEPSRR